MVSRESKSKIEKTDLIAIYRLEFYKKQKNWKLCAEVLKDKVPIKQSREKLLNITYNVDENQNEIVHPHVDYHHTGGTSLHNVAFCESDLDWSNAQKASPQKSQKLSQQWLEPVVILPTNSQNSNIDYNTPTIATTVSFLDTDAKLWSNTEKKSLEATKQQLTNKSQDSVEKSDNPKKTWIQERLQTLMQAAKLGGLEVQSEPILSNDIEFPIQNQSVESIGFDSEEYWENFSSDNHKDALMETGWMEEEGDAWRDEDMVDGGEFPATKDWWEDVQQTLTCWPEMDAEQSTDSVHEFIRGAHVVPHSSELDLALPESLEAGCGCADGQSLSVVSPRQLRAAVRAHSVLLARLLREARRRKNIQSSLSLGKYADLYSFEEPTRDVGPGPVPHEQEDVPHPTWKRDTFVAGSFRNSVNGQVGRGRGRLVCYE